MISDQTTHFIRNPTLFISTPSFILSKAYGAIIRDKLNPIEGLSDEIFLNRFRFPKQIALDILDGILVTDEFNDPQEKSSVPAKISFYLHFVMFLTSRWRYFWSE